MNPAITNTILIPNRCRERFLASSEMGGAILNACGIQSAGISKLAPPYTIGRTHPDFHVVLFCEAGAASFSTPEAEWKMTGGETVILPAGKPHLYRSSGHWNIVWFHLLASHHAWSGLPDSAPARRPLHDIGALRAVMELFMDEQSRRRGDADRVLEPLARAIAAMLERELCDEEPPERRRSRREIARAWKAVQADLDHAWTVEALASAAGLSVSQLHRKCLEVHGTSPMRWVRKMRVEQTGELLSFTSLSLAEIAYRVGYETPFALSKAFRGETGIAPGSYRKNRRQLPPEA
jgi:AraC-like DNA-binding protein